MANGNKGDINPQTGVPYGQGYGEMIDSRSMIDESAQISGEENALSDMDLNQFAPPTSSPGGDIATFEAGDIEDFEPYSVKINSFNDYNESRAIRQDWQEKWGRASGKLLTLAGTTLLDGTVGTLWGAAEAIGSGDASKFIDNEFSNSMLDIQEKVEKNLPNYYAKAEQTEWYNRLGTANFWADTIYKNLGFAIGALAAGVVTGGVSMELSGAKAASKNIMKRAARLLGKGMARNPEEAISMLRSGKYAKNIKATNLLAELQADAKVVKRGNVIAEITGSTLAAMGEGRIEALSAQREYYNKMVDGGTKEDEASQRATEHANTVFAFNTLLLTAGNYAQFRNVFAGGFKPNRLALDRIKGDFKDGFKLNKMGVPEIGARALKNPVVEGLEEMNQFYIQKFSEDFNTRRYDPEATSYVNDLLSSTMHALAESYGSAEGWENFVAGFVTGGLGVPNVTKIAQGKLPTFEGNVVSEAMTLNKLNSKAKEGIKELEGITNSEEYKAKYYEIIRDLSLQMNKDKALIEHDEFRYKNLEKDQLINHALTAQKLGKLEEYKQSLTDMKDLEASEIKELLKIVEKNEKGEDVPVSDPAGERPEKEYKDLHDKRIDEMLEAISEMEEISRDIEIKSGGTLPEDVKENLIYEAMTIDDTENRIESLSEDVNSEIGAFQKIDFQHYEDTGNIRLLDVDPIFTIADVMTAHATNSEMSKDFTDKYVKALDNKAKKDPQLKKKLDEGLRDKIQDLAQLYARRDNFITSYVDAFNKPQEKEFQLKGRKKELEDMMKELSASYQNLNLTDGNRSFFRRNTEFIKVKDPDTGEVAEGLNSKAFNISNDKGKVKLGIGHVTGQDNRKDKGEDHEDAEFEISKVNNDGNITLRDQNGRVAYYNKDGTFSYYGEVIAEFNVNEIRGFEENLLYKKVRAKVKALKKFADSQLEIRNEDLDKIQVLEDQLTELSRELKAQERVVSHTKTGTRRSPRMLNHADAKVAAKIVKKVSKLIKKYEKKRAKLLNNSRKYNQLVDEMKREIEESMDLLKDESLSDDIRARELEKSNFWTGVSDELNDNSVEDMDSMLDAARDVIQDITERLTELYKLRNIYKNWIADTTGRSVFDISDEDITKYIQDNAILSEIIKLEKELDLYQGKLEEFQTARVRLVFVADHFADLAAKSRKFYLASLGASFTKGFSTKPKDKDVETRISVKRDTGDPLPVFGGNKSSFLRTAGGNEVKPDDSNVKRWFDWMQSEESDNTKKTMRFLTFSKKSLPDELLGKVVFPTDPKLVDEAIALVPIDDKDDYIEFDGGIPFAFMTTAEKLKTSGFERFSYDKYREKLAKQYTDEGMSEKKADKKATKEVTRTLEKSQKGHDKLRKKLLKQKKGKEPIVYSIDRKEPGVRLNSEWIEPLGAIFDKKHNIEEDDVSIRVAGTDKLGYNGSNYDVIKGHVYIEHKGAVVPLMEKRLSETEDIDRVVRLIEYVLDQQERGEEKEALKIRNYLESIIYFSRNESSDYSFDFKEGDSKILSENRLYFGNESISLDEIRNAPGLLTNLKNFVGTKYHNISKKDLDAKSSAYQVLDVKDDGTIESLREFDNYQHYLLNDNGSGKFTVKIRPLSEKQFINRAFKLTPDGADASASSAKSDKASKILDDDSDDDIDYEPSDSDDDTGDDIDGDKLHKEVTKRKKIKGLVPINKSEQKALVSYFRNKAKEADAEDDILEYRNAGIEVNLLNGDIGPGMEKKYVLIDTVGTKVKTKTPAKSSTKGKATKGKPKYKARKTTVKKAGFEKLNTKYVKTNLINGTDEQAAELIAQAKKLGKEAVLIKFLGLPRNYKTALRKISKTPKNPGGSTYMLARAITGARTQPSKKEIDWFINLLPKMDVERIKGLIDDKAWGQLRKDLKILISDEAVEGVYYHEAFHAVSQVFMTEEQRQEMYNEIRAKGGTIVTFEGERKKFSELTDREAEELLAEEFRDYMLVGRDNYKFGETSEMKKSFFQMMSDFIDRILNLFNKSGVRDQTPSVFKEIADGSKQYTEPLVEGLKEDFNMMEIQRNGKTDVIKQSVVSSLMEDINANFFDTLFNGGLDGEISLSDDREGTLIDIYDDLLEHYEDLLATKEDDPDFVSDEFDIIVENFDLFKEKHLKVLKQYKIDPNKIRLDEDKRDGKTRGDNGINASNVISVHDYIPEGVRLLLVGLPTTKRVKVYYEEVDGDRIESDEVTKDWEWEIRSVGPDNNTAMKMNERYTQTVNTLHNSLNGLETMMQMKDKLMELAKNNSSFEVLVKRLGIQNLEEGDGYVANTGYLWKLQNDFITHFAKNKNNVLIAYVTEHSLNFIDAISETISKNVVDGWKSNVKIGNYRHIGENKLFRRTSKGEFLAKRSKAIKLYETFIDEDTTDNDVMELLGYFGVHFPKEYRSASHRTEVMAAATELVNWMFDEERGIPSLKSKNISFDAVFNKSEIRQNKEIKILSEAIAENQFEYIELQYMNQNGEMEYSVTLNTHLSNTINRLNNGTRPEHLKLYDPKTGKGNIPLTYSKWSKAYEKGKKQIEITLLRGLKSITGKGDDISKLKPTDFETMSVNAVLSGMSPYLRSAERKMEFSFSNPAHKSVVTDKIASKGYMEMLKATLIQNALEIADKKWMNKKNSIYDKLGKFDVNNLGFFNDIPGIGDKARKSDVPILVKELRDVINRAAKKPTKAAYQDFLKEAVEDTIAESKLNIEEAVMDYFNDSVKRTRTRMIDSGLVVNEGDDSYYPQSIDDNLLDGTSKIGVSPKSVLDENGNISNETFQDIARSVTYNYTMGAFEQTMLITGDIRHFYDSKKGWTDFHKRTTGAASTRTNSRNDEHFTNGADAYYPRLDLKSGEDRNHIREIVYSDIIRVNQSGYDKLNVADAQSEMTLDEYRETYLRNKPWDEELEKTWSFEQQMYLIRAADIGIYDKAEAIKNYKRLFLSHLPVAILERMDEGILPAVPYYNKTAFAKDPVLKPFPSIKTQGFGSLRDVNGDDGNSYKPNYTKHSVAPIMPSMISDLQLVKLSKLIEAKIGLGTFESGKKAETGLKVNYSLTELRDDKDNIVTEAFDENKHVQLMSYDDFGIQQEIDPSGKRNTTLSKQLQRLLFSNYDNPSMQKEHKGIVGKIVRAAEKKLFKDLGIEENKKVPGDYNFISKQGKKKFAKKLLEAFEKRDMSLNVSEGLEEALRDPDTVFDTLVSKSMIENTLHALIRKDLIQFSVKGDQLVQQSSALVDLGVDSKGDRIKLKWYERPAKKGEKGYKEGALVSSAEVIIALPKQIAESEWFQTLYYKGKVGLDALNLMIEEKHKDIPQELYEFAANRVPADDLHSIDYVSVKKFFPYHYGPNVIVPEEMVAKTGSDFDVDKLVSYFNNIIIKKHSVKRGGKKMTFYKLEKPTQYKSKESFWEDHRNKIIEEMSPDIHEDIIKPINEGWWAEKSLLKAEEHDFYWTGFEDGIVSKEVFEAQRDLYIEARDKMIDDRDAAIEKVVAPLKEKWLKENTLEDLNDSYPGVYENQLIRLHKKAVLQADRYDHLTKALNADTLKALAKKVAKSNPVLSNNLLEIVHNWDVAKFNWAGQAGVGQDAIEIVSHATTQLSPIHFDDKLFKIFFNGQELSEEPYKIGHTTTKGRKRLDGKNLKAQEISGLFGEFLTAFVDISEDPFIFDLNANSAVFPTYSLLIRSANEDNGTLDIEDAVHFLAQPIIREFVKKRDVQESAVNTVRGRSSNKMSKKDTVEVLIDSITGEDSGKNSLYEWTTEYLSYREGNKDRKRAGKEIEKITDSYSSLEPELMREMNEVALGKTWDEFVDWLNETGKGNKAVGKEEKRKRDAMRKMQGQILDNFLTYQQYARELNDLNQITRPDSDFTNSRTKLKLQRALTVRVKKGGTFSEEDINNLLNNTYLDAFEKIQKKGKNYFKRFFLTSRHAQVVEEIDLIINELARKKLRKSKNDLESLGQLIEADMITYLVHSLRTGEGRLSGRYKEMIITNPNSVARRLNEMQNRYDLYDNAIINEMTPIINEYVERTGENTGLDNIKIFSKSNRPEDVNSLKESFEELFDHEDEDVREFAKDLAMFGIIQSGYSLSHIDFKNIIPEKSFRGFVKEILSPIINDVPMDIKKFRKQFYRNNWNNTDLVPVVEPLMGSYDVDENSLIIEKGRIGYYNGFVAISRFKGKDVDGKPRFEKKLFERIKYTGDKKDLRRGKAHFQEISKLGNGFLYKEYHPEDNIDSQLDYNNYETIKDSDKKEPKIKGKKRLKVLRKVISGGQTGADRIGLEVGQGLGYKTGGIAPKGFKTESGNDKSLKKFNVKESTDSGYFERTKSNIKNSKGTVVFGSTSSPGTKLTIRLAKELGKPLIKNPTSAKLRDWINENNISTLNVAGNRLSKLDSKNVKRIRNTLIYGLSEKLKATKKSPASDMLSTSTEYESLKGRPTSDSLRASLQNFLNSIGVSLNQVEQVMDTKDINANGIARLSDMTIDILNNQKGFDALPEEAMHFYITMLPKDNALRKSLINSAHRYSLYDELYNEYANIYKDEQNAEELIRIEVASKLLGEHVKAMSEGGVYTPDTRIERWWEALIRAIRKMFNIVKENPYTASAKKVLDQEVSDLMEVPSITEEDEGSPELLPDLLSRDRLDYLSESEWSRREYQSKYKYTKKPVQKKNRENNIKQAQKVVENEKIPIIVEEKDDSLDRARAHMLENFDFWYPQEMHRNQEEKEEYIDMLSRGELEMYCF